MTDFDKVLPHTYDRDGKALTLREFIDLFGDPEYHRVALTERPNWTISTAFLFHDHSWGRGPRPLLYETMLLPHTEVMARYATEEEARRGHEVYAGVMEMSAEGGVERRMLLPVEDYDEIDG